MDEFTPESLKSFIGKPPADKTPVAQIRLNSQADRKSEGLTARARRIDEVLRNTRPREIMPDLAQAEVKMSDPDILDARARTALGEMVQYFMQKGMQAELQKTLLEHQGFIDNLLQLLQKEK